MDPLIDQLTSYAQDLSFDALPEEVVTQTKNQILDTVGCAIGAGSSPPAMIARAMAAEVDSRTPATVLVGGEKTSPDLAAFANGVMVRYLDFNDSYAGNGAGHPSDMLASTLACADAAQGDGKAAILGMALGYEVLCGLGEGRAGAGDGGRSSQEWDQATYGVVAAAVIAAKLLGLDREQMGHAISLATVSHLTLGKIRRGQLSYWKGCAVANASRNAVFSAMVAAKGMTGPDAVFQSPNGFFDAVGGPYEFQGAGSHDGPFRIMKAHTKAYPAGHFSQGPLDAVRELAPKISSTSAIKEVRVQTSRSGYDAMGSGESRWTPETRETADHSLPFVVAMGILEGGLRISHYDQEYFKRREVRAFMQKIRVTGAEEYESEWGAVPLTVVDVEMESGELLTAQVTHPLGHPQHPMTDADRERKFRSLAEPVLEEQQIVRLLDRLRNLERVERIGEVLELTVAR